MSKTTNVLLREEGLKIARQIEALRDANAVEMKRIHDEAIGATRAAQEELITKMKPLWTALLISEAIDPTEYQDWHLDLNYLLDHNICFLRKTEEEGGGRDDPLKQLFAQLGTSLPN